MSLEKLMDARVRLFAEEAMASIPPPSCQSLWRLDETYLAMHVTMRGVWLDAVHDLTGTQLFERRAREPVMAGPMSEMRPALTSLTLETQGRGRLIHTQGNLNYCLIPLPVLTAVNDPDDLRTIYHEPLAVRLDDTIEVAWAREPTPHLHMR